MSEKEEDAIVCLNELQHGDETPFVDVKQYAHAIGTCSNSLVDHGMMIAPQLRVEELRDDGHSSTGASDMDETLSDIEPGRSPVVSDNEGRDISMKIDQPFIEPTKELVEKIVNQVEFYFCDANILKDAFLLKHVKRNKQGYVSLKLVTSFRKMKALTRDYRVVAYSLSFSNKLEVNEEKTKVRRKEPLPDYDETTPSRTVVVVNLPHENPTIENVAELFSKCGEISLIRVLKPGKSLPPDVKKHLSKHPELGNVVCSVIEFENHLSAKNACETMTNIDDWRKGLQVTLLAIRKQEKSKTDKKKVNDNSDVKERSFLYNRYEDQSEPYDTTEFGKKSIKGSKQKGPKGEGDQIGSSDDEQVRRNSGIHGPCTRSSLSPKQDVSHLSPATTPRSTPRHTPKSSPRNSPNVHRKRTSYGKSPLALDNLSPGTSPKPSPCVSPELLRKGTGKLDATPSPGCSPWLQRKRLQEATGNKSPLVGSPMASPRIGRRLLDLEGVLRQPKGPDSTAGFYCGLGRGKSPAQN